MHYRGATLRAVCFVSLFLILSEAAWAQSSALPAPANSQPVTRETIGLLNNCLRFYPQAAVQAGLQGTTVIVVHLLTDGTVSNPRLAQSSGYDQLDQAAIACLQSAKTKPKTRNGIPLELDEKLSIGWRVSSSVLAAKPNGILNLCNNYYPPFAVRQNHQGVTLVSFLVSEDGTVKNPAVARSSGYPELDQAAVGCVSTYRYEPATANGKPVEYDSQVEIVWRLR
jgi:TonB family protein